MTEFHERRDEFAAAQQELQARKQEALLARENVRQLERALAEFDMIGNPRRGADRGRLVGALREAKANEAKLNQALEYLHINVRGLRDSFEPFTDPREAIEEWSDQHPILLFPLRLETRFKTTDAGAPELWVRVYPDVCLADSFEPSLTEQEVLNAQAFWASIWRAGGEESFERAAWRELAAAHGSGRAGWIIRQYLPLNPNDKPTLSDSSETILIVTTPSALPDEIKPFWEAVWRANGASDASQQAFADLESAVGAAMAAEIAEKRKPFNLTEEPKGAAMRANASVKVAVLQLLPLEDLQTRRTSWSSAPHVDLLPDRFVLVGYRGGEAPLVALSGPIHGPLFVGPDPNAPEGDRLEIVGDELNIPDNLKWMFDFDRAVEEGMAIRVPLNAAQARGGFDRLVVLGLRLADSPEAGVKSLSQLLEHQLRSRTGFEIVPQGTPTNNTEKAGSGYSYREDPDTTFRIFYQGKPQYADENDPLLRKDGQWMADLLGLPPDLVKRVPNADGEDQADARAMQIALWPGTLGHMMNALLEGVFSEPVMAATREFFTRYVSGRGPLPALRIGNQPYGILPTTDFSNLTWPKRLDRRDGDHGHPLGFYQFLKALDDDWKPLADKVNYIGRTTDAEGKPLDPHKVVADVVALHPSAAEYYPLQAESKEHKHLELMFYDQALAGAFWDLFPDIVPMSLLRKFGYMGEAPPLLNQIYKARQTPLTGPIIDDRPLSETEPIRKYAGDRNYIAWLANAARTGIRALQEEQGFDGGKKPAALLYLMLRHAMQMGFHDAGIKLVAQADPNADVKVLRREPVFIHIASGQEAAKSESRYELLLRPSPTAAGLSIGDHLAQFVNSADPELREQIEALERLANASTGRLERAFAEHIDCSSYRLDAWKMGLLNWQLQHLAQQRERGLFLGAYGWLEPIRPKHAKVEPAKVQADVAERLEKLGVTNLVNDRNNGGLIHAQSLNHATTAAVLRNGYLSHDSRMAIDLTSRRVRLALGVLEGMRNGQTLGALLGYQLERYVHDHGPLTVRRLVYPLRRAFPLVANQIVSGQEEPDTDAKESIAAMNVVDGRKMIEHVQDKAAKSYPFAADPPMPGDATAEERTVLEDALAHILDINDAVADLVLAEGVHQAVVGNYDRSAGTLDAFAKGGYPPEPEVIRTPKSGTALTLRAAIHLPLAPPAVVNPTAMSMAEPAVNAWLTDRLPNPDTVKLTVTYFDRATNAEKTVPISQTELGIQPIDALYKAASNPSAQSQAETAINLDDLVLQRLHANFQPHHGRPITINYLDGAGGVTWFQLRALLRSLNSLLVSARPLKPADIRRTMDAKQDQQGATWVDPARVQAALMLLRDTLVPALDAATTALNNPATILDGALSVFAATVLRFAAYRLPQTAVGFVYEWRSDVYGRVTKKLADRVAAWTDRLARADQLLLGFDNAPGGTPPEEQLERLRSAEALVGTAITGVPGPNYRNEVGAKRDNFAIELAILRSLSVDPIATLDQLLADTLAELPLSDFDSDPIDFQAEVDEVDRFRGQLLTHLADLKKDVESRIAKVEGWLVDQASADSVGQVGLMQKAAKLLFGDDFQLVPLIALSPDAADAVANAWTYSKANNLTKHLTDTVGRRFPVDDWLHGVARVRPKMNDWENALMLCEAMDAANGLDIVPLQIPFVDGESWLAMEFPQKPKVDGERLLYAANFAEDFDKTKPICGLLIDEWTEVIPEATQTTGVTFHFDRPNSEPPQCWLLALPAHMTGAWTWDELLGAVNDALDSAKKRAVEPVQLADTAYGWFLPATVSAYTFPEISISNNLLRNVKLYDAPLEVEPL